VNASFVTIGATCDDLLLEHFTLIVLLDYFNLATKLLSGELCLEGEELYPHTVIN